MRATALAIAVGISLLAVGPAFAQQPRLVSASEVRGHVVVAFELNGLSPYELVVAKGSQRLASGAFAPSNVRLRETIRLPASSGIARFRSRTALPPGRYYVEVSGVDLGGVTDCIPHQVDCAVEWSNMRRVLIPRTTA